MPPGNIYMQHTSLFFLKVLFLCCVISCPYTNINIRLTVHSEACRGSLATDWVTNGAAVLAGIVSVHWVDNQRPGVDGEARVGGKIGATFSPCHAGAGTCSPAAR